RRLRAAAPLSVGGEAPRGPDAWSAREPPAPHAGDGGAVDPGAADARLHTEVRSSAGGGEGRAAAAPTHFDPVGPREQRVLELARAALGAEIALAENALGTFLDLLGAVDEEYRLLWAAGEDHVAFASSPLRL